MTKEQMRAEIRLASTYYKMALAVLQLAEGVVKAERRRMQDTWRAYYQVADGTKWANMMTKINHSKLVELRTKKPKTKPTH